MLNVQRMLKNMDSAMFYKTLKIADLTDSEYTLLREFILRHNSRDTVCDILHVSISTFNNLKNKALVKIRWALSGAIDEKINHICY